MTTAAPRRWLRALLVIAALLFSLAAPLTMQGFAYARSAVATEFAAYRAARAASLLSLRCESALSAAVSALHGREVVEPEDHENSTRVAGLPLILVDLEIDGAQVRATLTHFVEYDVPGARWIARIPLGRGQDPETDALVEQAAAAGYFTRPVVRSYSIRLLSPPPTTEMRLIRCR